MSQPERLGEFLLESAERVDRHLDKTLPPAGDPPAVLHEAMRYAVFSGGKRLRPALAFGGAIAAGADPDVALPAAAAVELVHAYSLVHDDLPCMDDDDERRGRPTVHVKYGEANAVLTGDALLTEAFAQLGAAGPRAAALVGRLAAAAGSRELVGGQVDDLTLAGAAAGSLEDASVTSIHLRKTAALFRFAVVGGGLLGGREEPDLSRLDAFGRAYGLAYQLVDDLDDGETADECSMLRVLGTDAVADRARERIAEAREALSAFGAAAWVLADVAEALARRLR